MSNKKRLEEIRNQMIELFQEAKDIIRHDDNLSKFNKDRAKHYWMSQLEAFLVEEKTPMHECTMFETIDHMEDSDEDWFDDEDLTEEDLDKDE